MPGDVRPVLPRRALAFAGAALQRQPLDLPDVTTVSEISVAPMLFDATVWSGSVTFFSASSQEVWAGERDGGDCGDAAVGLRTDECLAPLPSRQRSE